MRGWEKKKSVGGSGGAVRGRDPCCKDLCKHTSASFRLISLIARAKLRGCDTLVIALCY